jgi:hypothetical protein
MNILLIFTLAILLFIVCYLLLCSNNIDTNTNINIPQTSFDSLNSDHDNMLKALDKFHDLCVDHWHEEERLYKLGKSKMPSNHKDMDTSWNEHNEQHKNFIDKIIKMRKELIEHIEKYDVPHFHWNKLI